MLLGTLLISLSTKSREDISLIKSEYSLLQFKEHVYRLFCFVYTENYSKKTGFRSNQSRHCTFIIYRVKTQFKKKACYVQNYNYNVNIKDGQLIIQRINGLSFASIWHQIVQHFTRQVCLWNHFRVLFYKHILKLKLTDWKFHIYWFFCMEFLDGHFW